MDILEQLEQIKAEHATAQTQLTEALASKSALDTLLAERDNDISQARKAVSDANALVADKDLELSNLKASLAELQGKQKTIEEKANEIVAAQGIAPLKVDSSAQAERMTRDDAIEKYGELRGKAKTAFFEAHKALIFDKGGAK